MRPHPWIVPPRSLPPMPLILPPEDSTRITSDCLLTVTPLARTSCPVSARPGSAAWLVLMTWWLFSFQRLVFQPLTERLIYAPMIAHWITFTAHAYRSRI